MSTSSILVITVLASGGDGEAPDLVDQRRAGDAELVGGAGAVAGVVLEGPLDVLPLEVVEAQGDVLPFPAPAPRLELIGEVLDRHRDAAAPQDQRALQHIAHLADV